MNQPERQPKVWARWDKTKPSAATYVGRPSSFGNPYSHLTGTTAAFRVRSREEAVREFEAWFKRQPELVAKAKAELRGRDLWCYCAPQGGLDFNDARWICHGQILGRIANE